ncbi:hypothetical protein AAC03nite_04510 [Alicyclobacillus acidoterrestris]|nr:hypothetical protein AAC03nite_04510 [Alicyclobacillus acidoterrestris]
MATGVLGEALGRLSNVMNQSQETCLFYEHRYNLRSIGRCLWATSVVYKHSFYSKKSVFYMLWRGKHPSYNIQEGFRR